MTGYIRKFEGNTTMSSKINNKQLLKKYNQMWKRVERLSKVEFDSKPFYGNNDKYIKTNIYIYIYIYMLLVWLRVFITRKCQKKKHHIIDSVIKANKKYYPQTVLEECKHEPKKIKLENLKMMI